MNIIKENRNIVVDAINKAVDEHMCLEADIIANYIEEAMGENIDSNDPGFKDGLGCGIVYACSLLALWGQDVSVEDILKESGIDPLKCGADENDTKLVKPIWENLNMKIKARERFEKN